jgi:hypothetical protein
MRRRAESDEAEDPSPHDGRVRIPPNVLSLYNASRSGISAVMWAPYISIG